MNQNNNPKKVFVLGGTGYVGEAVVSELLEEGHLVLLLTTQITAVPQGWLKKSNLQIVTGDARDLRAVEQIVTEFAPDTLIYLIGIIREWPKQNITWEQLHYKSFVDAVTISKPSVKHVIYMSADMARAKGTGYETTKFAAEEFLRKENKLAHTIFRPTILLGKSKRQHFMQVIKKVAQIPITPIFGGGKFRVAPVYRQDVAHLFVATVNRELETNQTYFVKGPDNITYRELVGKVKETFGYKGLLISVPLWPFLWLGRLLKYQRWFPFTDDQLKMLNRGLVSDDMNVWSDAKIKPRDLNAMLKTYSQK